jgi:hypothetical protein
VSLDRYFDTFNGKVAPKLNSDRIKNAIANMTNSPAPAKATPKKRKSQENSKKKKKN